LAAFTCAVSTVTVEIYSNPKKITTEQIQFSSSVNVDGFCWTFGNPRCFKLNADFEFLSGSTAIDRQTQSRTVREIIAGEIRPLFLVSHRRKRRIIVNAKLSAGAPSQASALHLRLLLLLLLLMLRGLCGRSVDGQQ